jgi:hypothetical protein
MSIEAIAVAWGKKIEDPITKYVLVAMADHADKLGGSIFPAAETVAEKTGLCEKTIRRHIKKLVADGFLLPAGVSKYGTKRYTIPMSDWTPSPTGGDSQSQKRDSKSPNPSSVNEPSLAANAAPVVIGETSITVMATNIVNSASLERDESETPKKDSMTDFFDHAVKAKTAAAIIRKWNLPVHLEDTCIEFASVFGIEADGPTPTITARSKSRWLGSAAQLYEIRPTHAELIKARDAAAGKYPIAHPGAAVNTIINLRAMNPKVAPLTHSAPVVFRDKVVNDDDE